MLQKLKSVLLKTHENCLPDFIVNNKRKRVIFYVAFYTLVATIFLTVFGQLPAFASNGITQLFQIGWIIALVPLLMLDYKRVLHSLTIVIILIVPFILYCLLALAFNIKSISYGGTTSILLALYIFAIGSSFGKYKNKQNLWVLLFSFLSAAFVYAFVVFFTKLMGNDLSNQIYAFGDKNSAGPIFMTAAIIGFYLFPKRKPSHIIIRWLIFIFFVVIVALSKNRAVLVAIPIILFPLLYFEIQNNKFSILLFLTIGIFVLLIFTIPSLYQNIIVNIFFNNKKTVDEIFSGRLTQIVVAFQNFKPFLGNGGNYFDCMPLSFLCSYGIIGFICLIPVMVFPFLVSKQFRKVTPEQNINKTLILLSILYICGSLFEGFGFFGPGAKVFVFWFIIGNCFFEAEKSFDNKKIYQVFTKSTKIVLKIPKATLAAVLSVILFVAPIVLSISSGIVTSIGADMLDKLPSSNRIASYVEVKDVQIDSPIDSMCIGQKITFCKFVNPIDAYDPTVRWSTGWIQNPIIDVNGYTGQVTAVKTGTALLNMDRFRIGPNGVYIQFPVKEYEKYNFDKLYISTNKFNKSFSNSGNESIEILNGCTQQLFYDDYYLPKGDDFEFVSSDESVAIIENNILRAVSPGTCEIRGVIHNSFNNESLNKITVRVEENSFVDVTSLDVDIIRSCYQYEPYKIEPIFNEDATDKNITLLIDGLDYNVTNKGIEFSQNGTAHIVVKSQNNPSFSKEFDLEVLENHPVSFECETNRMKIGEKKNAEQLGLHLCFSNGYKKVVTEDDIVFDPFDFTNRAWSDQNGLIENRTTVYAVKRGSINISYVSKIDNDVTDSFTIVTSVYSLKEYEYLSAGIGLVLIDIVVLISLAFSFFVDFKQKWIAYVGIGGFASLFLLIIIIKNGLNPFVITSVVLTLIGLAATLSLRFIYKKHIPLLFFEDPIEYEFKPPLPVSKNTIEIDI